MNSLGITAESRKIIVDDYNPNWIDTDESDEELQEKRWRGDEIESGIQNEYTKFLSKKKIDKQHEMMRTSYALTMFYQFRKQ